MKQAEIRAVVMMEPWGKLTRYLDTFLTERQRLINSGLIKEGGGFTYAGTVLHNCVRELSPRRGFYRTEKFLFAAANFYDPQFFHDTPEEVQVESFNKAVQFLIQEGFAEWDPTYKDGFTSLRFKLD